MFERAIALARQSGAQIVEIDFAPFHETAALLYQGPWVAERLAGIKDFFAAHPQDMHPGHARDYPPAARATQRSDAFEAAYRLQALKQRSADHFRRHRCHARPHVADDLYRRPGRSRPITLNSNLGVYTNFVNLLDLAAIAVPAGMREMACHQASR